MEDIKDDDTQVKPPEPDPEGEKVVEDEVHEPKEGSKRWKEVYHEAKEAGRKVAELTEKLAQREQDFELLRTQGDAQQSAIDKLADKVSTESRPDPNENPEAYDDYIVEKLERKTRVIAPQPTKQPAPLPNTARNESMEHAMAAAKEDYYDVINQVRPDMEKDAVLRNQIWGSVNPYSEAYKYGTEKIKRAKQRDDDTEQGYVEGETIHTGTDTKGLSAEEKQVCLDLNITEAGYLKQREFINNDRARG